MCLAPWRHIQAMATSALCFSLVCALVPHHGRLQRAQISRRMVPIAAASSSSNELQPLDHMAFADRAIAWFDELSMLEVIYRGQLAHDAEGMSAADLEAAIAAGGGNVSAALTHDERTRPSGDAVQQLVVGFSVDLDGGLDDESEESATVRLGVRFDARYPLQGGRPAFTLVYQPREREAEAAQAVDGTAARLESAVISAAAAAAEAALQAGEETVIFSAISAANDALEVALGAGPQAGPLDFAQSPTRVETVAASREASEATRGEATRGEATISEYLATSAGAWAVLREHGEELHEVLTAWDEQRSGVFGRPAFRQVSEEVARDCSRLIEIDRDCC